MAAAANQKNAKGECPAGGAPAKDEPKEMETEFREGDTCLQANVVEQQRRCFRSTLEKTFPRGLQSQPTESVDGSMSPFAGPVWLQG